MGSGSMLLILALLLVVLPGKAAAFGAGNIPSIAQVEGHNWRHGDIEDLLKTLAFIKGKKWTTLMVSRVYFGNWLRDYSQAVDVGALKGVNAATIRILVWVLSFLAHGYATEEFEVTEERLGCYRPEEHIDNPLGYADGEDARTYDKRLRGPVDPRELEIDPQTGMKNYIANERGGWATSAGYLRHSFARSIHYGRMYTSSRNGSEADLCEALRCLGQALHCMEDFSAHSNYCELALIELGYRDVFTHCGRDTQIYLRGKRVYPLVTGTFGAVDFLHSVMGEANDHFTQSEVDEVDIALKNAEQATRSTGGSSSSSSGGRGLFGLNLGALGALGGGGGGGDFISLISKLPGSGDGLSSQARSLKADAEAQEQRNRASANPVPGMSPDFDPVQTAAKIYPILEFRDKIVRSINNTISKIPGLESLLETIGEKLTAFIMGLLAPYIRPIIAQVSLKLKEGSSGLINSSADAQYEPWNNPRCDNPTHSMLSKDHFTNILNSCAGRVAATILQYVVPRVLYAWENPGVPVDEVVDDVLRAFHHPANRDDHVQIQREMFDTVRKWTQETKYRHDLNRLLSSEAVRNHDNHILTAEEKANMNRGGPHSCGGGGHGKTAGSLWAKVNTRDIDGGSGSGGYGGGGQSSYQSRPSPRPYEQQHRPPSSGGYSGGGGAAASYFGGGGSQYDQPQHHHRPPHSPHGSGYAGSPPPPQQGYGQGYYPPQPQYGGHSSPPPQQHHYQQGGYEGGGGGYGGQPQYHQPPPPQQDYYGGGGGGGYQQQPPYGDQHYRRY